MALVSAATAGLAVAYTMVGGAQTSSDRQDEEAIRKVIMEMREGFNTHDVKAATRMYAPDADFVTVRGEAYKGAADIERGLTAIFATRAKDARSKTLDVTIRLVRPDVAIAHVTNELNGFVDPDGQRVPTHPELSLRVLVIRGHGASLPFTTRGYCDETGQRTDWPSLDDVRHFAPLVHVTDHFCTGK